MIGPHTIGLARQVADANRRWSIRCGNHAPHRRLPIPEFTHLLAVYERRREPLPLLPDHMTRRRIAQGWSPEDPLTPIALGTLARQAGFTQFMSGWLPDLRNRLEAMLSVVDAEKPFGHNAVAVDTVDNSTQVA